MEDLDIREALSALQSKIDEHNSGGKSLEQSGAFADLVRVVVAIYERINA